MSNNNVVKFVGYIVHILSATSKRKVLPDKLYLMVIDKYVLKIFFIGIIIHSADDVFMHTNDISLLPHLIMTLYNIFNNI